MRSEQDNIEAMHMVPALAMTQPICAIKYSKQYSTVSHVPINSCSYERQHCNSMIVHCRCGKNRCFFALPSRTKYGFAKLG